MSNENFDKKIREKLVNHIPKYDSGAWQNFSKLLPAPWYTKLFTNNLGWVIGGLSTSALLFTIYLTNTKNELLNDEISTLKNQIEIKNEILPADANALAQTDTVYITQEVNKYIRVAISEEKSFQAGIEKGYADASKDIAYLQSEIDVLRKEQLAQKTSELLHGNASLSESQKEFLAVADNKSSDTPSEPSFDKSSDDGILQQNIGSLPENQTEVSEEVTLAKDVVDESMKSIVEDEKEIVAQIERTTPEKPKKKVNWPKMRFGINTDYLGLKVLSTGPAAEVFITDKFSFNASAIFSGQVETTHPFAKDFNKMTGKDFDNEYKPFVDERTEHIEDISIKTSFVKLPLYFNYYINTWSRFNFLISAGTKLDLSVYQDVGYFSGPLGFQTRNRFEAKAKPKTFNNLFYGMGLQYQYKGFVGQVTPYFDFAFRRADYFVPSKNFGVNASLKFEFGK